MISKLLWKHIKYWMPTDSVYLSVHIGREGKEDIGYTGDNIGENISLKNSYTYWESLLKNLETTPIIVLDK